jgi:hypothetical protein
VSARSALIRQDGPHVRQPGGCDPVGEWKKAPSRMDHIEVVKRQVFICAQFSAINFCAPREPEESDRKNQIAAATVFVYLQPIMRGG